MKKENLKKLAALGIATGMAFAAAPVAADAAPAAPNTLPAASCGGPHGCHGTAPTSQPQGGCHAARGGQPQGGCHAARGGQPQSGCKATPNRSQHGCGGQRQAQSSCKQRAQNTQTRSGNAYSNLPYYIPPEGTISRVDTTADDTSATEGTANTVTGTAAGNTPVQPKVNTGNPAALPNNAANAAKGTVNQAASVPANTIGK